MNKKTLINSIFYPRKSFIHSDEDDILIGVDESIKVGIRLFLKDKTNPIILYFHGNAELAQEYNAIAKSYNNNCMNLIETVDVLNSLKSFY